MRIPKLLSLLFAIAATATAAATAPAAAQVVYLGGEIPVNATTTGSQIAPALAAGSTLGRFFVVWQSFDQDGSGAGVYGRLFAADGTSIGDEARLSTTTAGDQVTPAVASRYDLFKVVWASQNRDGDGYGVVLRLFDESGQPIGGAFGGELVVNTDHRRQPDPARPRDGGPGLRRGLDRAQSGGAEPDRGLGAALRAQRPGDLGRVPGQRLDLRQPAPARGGDGRGRLVPGRLGRGPGRRLGLRRLRAPLRRRRQPDHRRPAGADLDAPRPDRAGRGGARRRRLRGRLAERAAGRLLDARPAADRRSRSVSTAPVRRSARRSR